MKDYVANPISDAARRIHALRLRMSPEAAPDASERRDLLKRLGRFARPAGSWTAGSKPPSAAD
jgi:hypothetical protein